MIGLDRATMEVDMDHPRIVSDPAVMMGKPVVRGTRITVEFILRMLGSGWTVEEFVREYDHVSREDVLAAQTYAAERLAAATSSAAE